VVGFFPAGLAGLGMLWARRRKRSGAEPTPEPDNDPDAEKVGARS